MPKGKSEQSWDSSVRYSGSYSSGIRVAAVPSGHDDLILIQIDAAGLDSVCLMGLPNRFPRSAMGLYALILGRVLVEFCSIVQSLGDLEVAGR
jgi:hypothetical protein